MIGLPSMRPWRRSKVLMARLRKRLKSRPDTEHEMSINRLSFSLIWIVGLGVAAALGRGETMIALTGWTVSVYLVISIGIFGHIIAVPDVHVPRRIFAMATDFAVISYGAWAGGEASGWLYPLYLWTVFGNGFRFGLPYLHAAMAMAIVGFVTAATFGGYWAEHTGVVIALLVGLTILPLYAGVLIRKLSEAKKHAEEASRAKSLFLASVSHELRTPLNAIIGFSDLLARNRLDPASSEMVRSIATSGRSLLSLIDGLLDFTRLEAGRMPVSRAPFDLHALLRRASVMLSVEACRKGLRLAVHVGSGVPRIVVGDERHLEEVIVNLASNAVKFTAEGYVLIKVERGRRDAGEGRVGLQFAVADTGIGIAPEAQARVFESFTQADETIIDRFGGTGLGLAIVRQLVEMMGGKVRLKSALGQGSTFSFDAVFGAADAPRVSLAGPLLLVTADGSLVDEMRAIAPDMLSVATPGEAADVLAAEAAAGNALPPVLVDERIGTPAISPRASAGCRIWPTRPPRSSPSGRLRGPSRCPRRSRSGSRRASSARSDRRRSPASPRSSDPGRWRPTLTSTAGERRRCGS